MSPGATPTMSERNLRSGASAGSTGRAIKRASGVLYQSPRQSRNADGSEERILAILESLPNTSSPGSAAKPSRGSGAATPRRRSQGTPTSDVKPSTKSLSRSPHFQSTFKRPLHHRRHHGRRGRGQISVHSNGMPPPPIPNKVNFRTRALDPIRQMSVFVYRETKKEEPPGLDMLSNKNAIKKPLFNVPSGMEKEEEREHHLRKAIEAQKNLAEGVNTADRFIPTRHVEYINPELYTQHCRWRGLAKSASYIKHKRGDFDYCDEDTSYDADEDDVAFLSDNGDFLSVDEFEKVIEKLELMTRERVPTLNEFYRKHPWADFDHLKTVYEYWMSRKEALLRRTRSNMCLVPYIPCKTRPGEKDNPYIAFRHRGPKVMTRRKQKSDAEQYGSMLKLAETVKVTHDFTKVLVKRDSVKLSSNNAAEDMFDQELECLMKFDKDSETVNLNKLNSGRGLPIRSTEFLEMAFSDVPDEIFGAKPTADADENLLNIISKYSNDDGDFAFVKDRNCRYRLYNSEQLATKHADIPSQYSKIPNGHVSPECEEDKSRIEVQLPPSLKEPLRNFVQLDENGRESLSCERRVLVRSRFGRGGRLNIDYMRQYEPRTYIDL